MMRDIAKFNYWTAFVILLLAVTGIGHAQQAQLKIICDKDGQEIYLDGEFKTTCDAGEPVRIIVPPGKHVVEAKRPNDDGSFFYFKKEFKIGGGVQKIIEVQSEISYTPEYYKRRCENGVIDGCFMYLHNATKEESYWETAKLKYFEHLCDKGSVRGCAYLHSIGKMNSEEFRNIADRRFAGLYAKLMNLASTNDAERELLKYKVYLVDPQAYLYDTEPLSEEEDGDKGSHGAEVAEFLRVFIFEGVYYAPVALYLDEKGDRAYYLIEVENLPGEDTDLNDPDKAPASLLVSLPSGETGEASLTVESKGKLKAYETALTAGDLKGSLGKALTEQTHKVVLKSINDSRLMTKENVVFNSVAVYSEDYLYKGAKYSKSEVFYRAYLQLYPNGKYAQEIEQALDDLYWAKCDTIEGCQAYLEAVGQEPWAMHVAEAKRKIKELEAAREKAAYEACKEAEEVAPCNAYLKKYPEGEYASLAQLKINDIKRAEEKAAYEACKEADEVAPCNAYLKKYPEGEYASLAQLKINDIKRAEEKAAYEACKNASEPTPCRRYLDKYPEGAYRQMVELRIEEIKENKKTAQEKAAYEACKSASEPTPCKRYLAKYPNGKFARNAQSKIDDIFWKRCTDIEGCITYINVIGKEKWAKHTEEARERYAQLSCQQGSAHFCLSITQNANTVNTIINEIFHTMFENNSWRLIIQEKFKYGVQSISFSPDGQYLAVGGQDGSLRIYKTSNWTEVGHKELEGWVHHVAFSADGRYLAEIDGRPYNLRVFSIPELNEIKKFKSITPILRPTFSHDGRFLATRSPNELIIFNTDTWTAEAKIKRGDCIAFGPNDRYAVVGSFSYMYIFDISTWDLITKGGGLSKPAIDPKGKYLAAIGNNSLYVYEIGTWKRIQIIQHVATISPVFSPDGQYLVTYKPYMLRAYNISTWKEVMAEKIDARGTPVFSPDSRFMAVFAPNLKSNIILYDTSIWQAIKQFRMGEHISFDPNSQYLAIGSVVDQTLRVYSVPIDTSRYTLYTTSSESSVRSGDLFFTPVAFYSDSKGKLNGYYVIEIDNGSEREVKAPTSLVLKIYDNSGKLLAESSKAYFANTQLKPGGFTYAIFEFDSPSAKKLYQQVHALSLFLPGGKEIKIKAVTFNK